MQHFSSKPEKFSKKMQIYAVCLIKMHPAKKKENIQRVLMHGILNLKPPFVVCVSSGPGVMKWLWHFISDSCGDKRPDHVQTDPFHCRNVRQLFIWISHLGSITVFNCKTHKILTLIHDSWVCFPKPHSWFFMSLSSPAPLCGRLNSWSRLLTQSLLQSQK